MREGEGVMSDSDKELEKQILEARETLIHPPSSVDELLSLLDKIFICLSRVEHSPPDSMENALSPLMKELVGGKLFKHSDVDVNVAVAACISEITRINAPEAPYNDDQMKEVFKLFVSSFENLDDNSSRSYSKRTSILERVAKAKSCVFMLDLKCDALLIEMFQNFLKAIRDHHSENVFSSMVNIMTDVLEDSEDIPPKMLSPILHYVRKDDEVSQVSRRLAEQVLSNCASKLTTYLTEAVESSGVPLEKYSKIVDSICVGPFSALQQDQPVANGEEASGLQNQVENLVVGSKIRVWWPMDRAYYTCTVNSYDSAKKKHVVCYADDENTETLDMKKELWHFLAESEEDDETESKPKDSKEANREEEDSSKSKKEIAKSGKSKEQGDSGTSKKKEEPSKTTTTSSKSKSGPAKSSSAKGKVAKGKAKFTPDETMEPAQSAEPERRTSNRRRPNPKSKPKDSKEANREEEDSSKSDEVEDVRDVESGRRRSTRERRRNPKYLD